jgi:predicted phage tail component-like protein
LGFTVKDIHSRNFKIHLAELPKIPMTPEIKDHYETIAGKHGSYLFPQPFGDRMIEVECLLLADSKEERAELVLQIAQWLFTVQKTLIVFDHEPNVFFIGKLDKQIDFDSSVATGKISLTFRCEPFKYSTESEQLQFKALNNSYKEFTASGTFEIQPIVQIQAKYGLITKPTLDFNGFIFTYDGDILNGGQIIINSKDFATTSSNTLDSNVTGAIDLNANSVLNKVDGSFPIMQGGINSIRYSSTNGQSAEIIVSWQPTYI